MFNINTFKRNIKEWLKENPYATVEELSDFCEEQIPSSQFASYKWLIEQTQAWYENILKTRTSDLDEQENSDDQI